MSIDDPDPDPDPDRSPRPHLRVVVTDGRGRVRRADRLRRWLAEVAPESASGEVVIALVGDRKMRDLNQRYRGVDRATDVLSFPVMSEAPPDARIEPAAHAANDGDGADGRRAERAAPPEPFGGAEFVAAWRAEVGEIPGVETLSFAYDLTRGAAGNTREVP